MWSTIGIALFAAGLGALVALVAARLRIRRSQAKASIAERRARAAERMAELGAMTGGLAHEIKNPLSTIGLNAQLLGEQINDLPIPDDDKGRLSRRVLALRRETDRLRGILTDFLEYAGELRLDPREADLNALVAELADFFMPQCEQNSIRLRTDLAPGSLPARLDVPHLKQAVLNLLLNAVQAFGREPAGAPREIILRTLRAQEPDNSPVVRLHVIDTGPGIPAEALPKIFTPYFTTKSGGTGLGLPTTRRIIEAHQGRLDVHTEPGRGTDFTISLPGTPQ